MKLRVSLDQFTYIVRIATLVLSLILNALLIYEASVPELNRPKVVGLALSSIVLLAIGTLMILHSPE